MNSVTTGSLHAHLREEEVLVVENAIRLAIDSIINVLYGVNSARTNEYQRMVGDRDKEIQRLECRLRELERDLQAPRQPVCTCGVMQKTDCSRFLVAQVCADPQPAQQSRYEPNSSDPELTKQDCERSATGTQEAASTFFLLCNITLIYNEIQLHKKIQIRKLKKKKKKEELRCAFSDRYTYLTPFSIVARFERPSLYISFQSNESSIPLSPSRRALRQSGTSRSSEPLRTPDAVVNVPTSPSSSVVKEEPCDIDKVFIQWEISQQESQHQQEDGDTQENKTPAENRNVSHFSLLLEWSLTLTLLSFQYNLVVVMHSFIKLTSL